MIELTKINGEPILINPRQIEYIDLIPESKITMMNGRFHIVREDKDDIVSKILKYKREIHSNVTLEG